MNARFQNFSEFWPFYVGEHARRGTRQFHFAGTSLLFLFLVHAFATHSLYSLAGGIVAAYGFAWTGHFFIEKNRPATFQYPLFSLIGDFKMYGLMLSGKMNEEIERLTKTIEVKPRT